MNAVKKVCLEVISKTRQDKGECKENKRGEYL